MTYIFRYDIWTFQPTLLFQKILDNNHGQMQLIFSSILRDLDRAVGEQPGGKTVFLFKIISYFGRNSIKSTTDLGRPWIVNWQDIGHFWTDVFVHLLWLRYMVF